MTFGYKEASVSQDSIDVDTLNFWFEESFDVWFRESTCAASPYTKVPVDSTTPGVVEYFFATGIYGIQTVEALVEASLTIVGFRDMSFFDFFPNVLGVAFTDVWVTPSGDPSDINGDGYEDKGKEHNVTMMVFVCKQL